MPERVTIPLLEISRRIKGLALPKVDVVVGIATGGIAPASIIAHQFDRPLAILHINFRAIDNSPQRESPALLREMPSIIGESVLLVDDVSVTGATLVLAMSLLQDRQVTTLVLKGKGDIILFPELATCVNWPWSGMP